MHLMYDGLCLIASKNRKDGVAKNAKASGSPWTTQSIKRPSTTPKHCCDGSMKGSHHRPQSMRSRTSSSIKHDDAAQRLAGLNVGKPLVDLGEFQLGRDPVLQVQLAAHVEFDETGHVDAEMVGAHRRALDPALAQEIKTGQLDLL